MPDGAGGGRGAVFILWVLSLTAGGLLLAIKAVSQEGSGSPTWVFPCNDEIL